MYIVIFNGPPRSGKDTLARMVADHMDSCVKVPVKEDSLSLPLRLIAYGMVSRTYNCDSYEDFKKEFFPRLNRTGRELMIDASEKFLKVCYGQPVMADLLVMRNQNFDGVLLIRDGGFQLEVDTLASIVGVENVYIVRMHREGCDFSQDSREYVSAKNPKHQMQTWNNSDLADLEVEARRIYGRLVNQMGWVL